MPGLGPRAFPGPGKLKAFVQERGAEFGLRYSPGKKGAYAIEAVAGPEAPDAVAAYAGCRATWLSETRRRASASRSIELRRRLRL